jgi:hypothetical protein
MLAVVALGLGMVPAATAADRLKDVQNAIADQQERLKYLGLQAGSWVPRSRACRRTWSPPPSACRSARQS